MPRRSNSIEVLNLVGKPLRPASSTPSVGRRQPASPVRRQPASPIRRDAPAPPVRRNSGADSAVQRESRVRTGNPVADQALAPWSEYPKESGKPDFHGRNASGWLNEQRDMMQAVNDKIERFDYVNPRAGFMQEIAAELGEEFGISSDEAMRNMVLASNHRGRGIAQSNAVQLNVPGAAADEKMGVAALQLSGFDDVQLLNTQSEFATDLQARFAGQLLNIDSQKLMNSRNSLPIGAFQNVELDQNIFDFLEGRNSQSVLKALQELQEASRRASGGGLRAGPLDVSAQEGKLFETLNPRFNPNPSEGFINDAALRGKNALLVSDHSDFNAPFPEFGSGSFDARQPQSMHLMDLDALRNTLDSLTVADLERFGGEITSKSIRRGRKGLKDAAHRRGNDLSDVYLNLPKSILKGSHGNLSQLSDEAIATLTQSLL